MKRDIDNALFNSLFSKINKLEFDNYELDKECFQLFDSNQMLYRALNLMAGELKKHDIDESVCKSVSEADCGEECIDCIVKYYLKKANEI